MEPMLNMALRSARKAGEIIEQAFERLDLVRIEEKGRNDFVSEVDRMAEREIIQSLSRAYPEHRFLGEEGGGTGPEDAEYQWIIDPLDGTTNFLHGIPQFAVSIACLYRGTLQHGVVIDPIKREEYTASKGKGAMLNGRRMRVSNRKSLENAIIGTGIPFTGYPLEHIDAYAECMKEISVPTAGIRRAGSAALDLAYVAAGRFDGFWEMGLKEWDMAAGALLIKESGGMLSDFKGGNDWLDSGCLVSATPKAFKPLLQIVGKHMGHLQK